MQLTFNQLLLVHKLLRVTEAKNFSDSRVQSVGTNLGCVQCSQGSTIDSNEVRGGKPNSEHV